MAGKAPHTAYLDLLLKKHLTRDIAEIEAESLAEHLSSCAACRREEALLLKKKSLLEKVRLPGLSEDFKPALFKKLGLPYESHTNTPRQTQIKRYGLLVAASVCLLFSGVFALRFFQDQLPDGREVVVEEHLRPDQIERESIIAALVRTGMEEHEVRFEVYSDRPYRPHAKMAKGKRRVIGPTDESLPPGPENVVIVLETTRRELASMKPGLNAFIEGQAKSGVSYRIEYRMLPEFRRDFLILFIVFELFLRLFLSMDNRRRKIIRGYIVLVFGSFCLPLYFLRFLKQKRPTN